MMPYLEQIIMERITEEIVIFTSHAENWGL